MTLEAKSGVNRDQADLLSDNLIAALRETHAFARVVSPKEMEGVLGLEQQKQLLECNSQACMAEIAGALNVDLLLSGGVGQLGTAYLLNLRLIDARTGVGLASVSERVDDDVTKLLDRVRPALQNLLQQAHPARAAAPVAEPRPASSAPSAAAPPPAHAKDAPQPATRWKWKLAAGGAVALAGAGGVLLGAALVAGGVLTRVVAPELPDSARYVVAWVPAWISAVALGCVLVLAALGAGAGGAAVAAWGAVSP